MRYRKWLLQIVIGASLTSPAAHAAFKTCETAATVGSNIADPVPEGRIDNAAPAAVGNPFPPSGYVGSAPSPSPDNRGIFYNLLWGSEFWEEPTRECALTYQVFDFQPAKDYNPKVNDGKTFPVMVYFHPNGEVHGWETNSRIDLNVAQKARDLNYHFISVEFRHPVADQYLYEDPPPNFIPHTDVGLFIQFMRQKAPQMKIDARNVFVFGRSRGALALWQGLQPDMGSGNTSSAISGFIGYQAQTSYQCDIFANLYLSGAATDWRNNCKSLGQNRYDNLFGNAISSINSETRLPVMLQYEHNFKLVDGSDTEIRKILPSVFDSLSLNEQLHYANFGMAFYNRYTTLGLGDFMAKPVQGVFDKFQFVGWEDFVLHWKKP
jgi:acetyl esterase/lipase